MTWGKEGRRREEGRRKVGEGGGGKEGKERLKRKWEKRDREKKIRTEEEGKFEGQLEEERRGR